MNTAERGLGVKAVVGPAPWLLSPADRRRFP